MTTLKNLPAAVALLGSFAIAHAQDRVQPAAPEPATAPSEAIIVPLPARAPSERLVPAATITYSFELMDANRDNAVSREEADRVPELGRIFEQLDRNRDRVLDRSEFVGVSR
jgi:hypothetical protein